MSTNKILVSGLIGGVVFFLLGWVVYGMLLMGFMEKNMSAAAADIMRADSDMVWWALILGNIAFGMLLAVIFGRWAGINTASTGAMAGAVIAFLMALSFDMTMYGTADMMSITGAIVDIIVYTGMGAAVGAAVAWWLGRK